MGNGGEEDRQRGCALSGNRECDAVERNGMTAAIMKA
jgi:hypothetical protein